jgi:hypothetical protein
MMLGQIRMSLKRRQHEYRDAEGEKDLDVYGCKRWASQVEEGISTGL